MITEQMRILVIDQQWMGGANGAYTSLLEVIGHLPEGHDLKVLGKYHAPPLGDLTATAAIADFSEFADICAWVNQAGWLPDLIWLNDLNEIKLGDCLSQSLDIGRRIPIVATIRAAADYLSPDSRNRLLQVAAFTCASEFGAREWKGHYGLDVHIIPNSVGAQFKPDQAQRLAHREYLRLGDSDRLLLYTGRLETAKGIGHLPYILREAQACRPDLTYHLALVGKQGPLPADFKMLMKNMNPPKMRIYPWSNTPEIWMQAADCFLFPVSWDELFGKVLIEAMACGCPVLAADKGGISEILTGDVGQRLLQKETTYPADWGQAIAALEDINMSKQLIQFVEPYAVKNIAAAFEALFTDVLRVV